MVGFCKSVWLALHFSCRYDSDGRTVVEDTKAGVEGNAGLIGGKEGHVGEEGPVARW